MTPPPRDPGLQPERTALAWHRTSLAAVTVCVVLALGAVRLEAAAIAVAAAALTCAAPWLALRSRSSPWTSLSRTVALVVVVAVVGGALAVQGLVVRAS